MRREQRFGIVAFVALMAAGCDEGDGDQMSLHAEFDAQCAAIQTEEECTPAAAGAPDAHLMCDWVVRYTYAPGSCEPLDVVEECRGVDYAGAGCVAAADLPGCSDSMLDLNSIFPGANMPFIKTSDEQVEVVSGQGCGAPPGFAQCSSAAPTAAACSCPCTQ